jgi:hypothetical protein
MSQSAVAGLPLLATTCVPSTVKASGQTPSSKRSERALNSLCVLIWTVRWSGWKKHGSPRARKNEMVVSTARKLSCSLRYCSGSGRSRRGDSRSALTAFDGPAADAAPLAAAEASMEDSGGGGGFFVGALRLGASCCGGGAGAPVSSWPRERAPTCRRRPLGCAANAGGSSEGGSAGAAAARVACGEPSESRCRLVADAELAIFARDARD